MKHYGIYIKDIDKWMTDDSGIIFWTTSKIVAEEQLKLFHNPNSEVREFNEAD